MSRRTRSLPKRIGQGEDKGLDFEGFLAATASRLPHESTDSQRAAQDAVTTESLPRETTSTKAETSDEEIGRAACIVYSWFEKVIRNACGKSPLRPEQLATIETISKHTEANLAEFAKKLRVDSGTVTRRVKALEKQGFVSSRRGKLRKHRATIAHVDYNAPELSRLRARVGSDIKAGLAEPNGSTAELGRAFEQLESILRAAVKS